ncbi:MAG: TIR domain-containing protein [Calothrix sp. MO_192.B10]|nr:TIR domain-containing protein [Calothrix sp. MO_192.B10]
MTKLFDAFISYGRQDSKAFATKLQARLNEQGLKVWFDFNDIPLGVDFQNQIDDGIEKACHFLFIIAPHSVNSPYCAKEIELAIKHNKRIIPLLHVESINRGTWQQRNPKGTDEEWSAYKAEGKHDHFQNMHPTIRKINWVYFREEVDDFEQSLAGLIKLLKSHADYVEQHTKLLINALEWERNQKQTRYLLTGEEKQQAQSWLKIRFKDEQPPCVPTDLHCEYITESIKNGNNLMTEVFLSYADEDRGTMEEIRRSLRREGITVWTNTTDIQTGEEFVEAINRGIEQADNVVYLLSPDSVNSTYCQQELDLAVSLNKRIIPILVRETEEMQVPSVLRYLHYIDLTDNLKSDDYLVDESQLLKILYDDAAYYNEHKILLTKALKWQRQQNNPSILLRGYNLRSAQTWLEVAQKRTQHLPTPLQSEFINESHRQPPLESLDVFISYSRADSDLARKLNDSLQIQGKRTWFDQESIASGSDFQQEINRGINACDNFLFILSPRSVNSPYCKDEVEYAASLNKRFVTVLHRQVNTNDLHPELAKVQWIDFNGHEGDFNANFNQLVRTLDTDREHVRSHSKWSHRSLEWEYKDKSNDLLLRGSEFLIAQNWLQETEQQKKKPAATALHYRFIEASQNAIELAEKEEKRRQTEMLHLQEEKRKEAEARLAEQKKSARRQKLFLVATSIGLVVAVVLATLAKNAEEKAERAQEAQLNSVSRFSLELSQENLKFDALLEAIRAGNQIRKLGKEASPENRSLILAAFQTTVYDRDGFTEQNRFTKHKGTVFDVAWSPDGEKIATASGDGTLRLWNLNGKEIKTIPISNKNEVYSVSFSPDGKTIAFASDDNTVKISSLQEEQPKIIGKHNNLVWSVAWSPDGKTIASASEDNTVKLWDKQGKLLRTLTGHQQGVRSVSFSRDGKTIATASEDGTIKLWNVNNGRELTTIRADKNNHKFYSVSFSPDGKIIASGSGNDDNNDNNDNNTVRLWNKQGKLLKARKAHDALVWNVAWSPDGKIIASASDDNTVKLWDKQGKLLQTLKGHHGSIKSVKFSPDGKKIATASEDNTVKIWRLSDNTLQRLKGDNEAQSWSVAWSPDGKTIASGRVDNTIKIWTKEGKWKFIPTKMEHEQAVSSVSFSPDGNTIASASKDNTIKLWNKQGKELKTLEGHKKPVWSIAWSPDGNTIASGSGDNTIKLWNKQGKELKKLEGHKGTVWNIAWSPDGNTIASGSGDNTIKLWNKQGKLLKTLEGHDASVASVAWSPKGNTIASASNDNTVKLWSKKGEKLKTLKGHHNDVLSVTFSPDGKKIASASKDSTVKLWNIDGQELQTLNGHKKRVTSVSFSSDGKTLASASDDKTVILWNLEDLTLPKLMQNACAMMGSYLKYNAPESDRNLCDKIVNLKSKIE